MPPAKGASKEERAFCADHLVELAATLEEWANPHGALAALSPKLPGVADVVTDVRALARQCRTEAIRCR